MTPLTRLPDWQSRMDECVRARLHQPFAWGAQDCVLFGADCVAALTGRDLAEGSRGYDTALAATRILHKRGGVEALVREVLGEPITFPLMARVGDVGIVQTPEHGDTVVVCAGPHWLAPGEQSLVHLPLDSARAAWRVG